MLKGTAELENNHFQFVQQQRKKKKSPFAAPTIVTELDKYHSWLLNH